MSSVSRREKARPPRLRVIAAIAFVGLMATQPAGAQNLLEFLFGGGAAKPQRQAPQPQQSDSPIADFFADPFGLKEQPASRPASAGGSGPAFCVRSCDGKFFALASRANASPAQMCQAFCPATATRVYFGSAIEHASTERGERYADAENAFAFRTALKSDCTCTGKGPAGLAAIDLSLDASLRPGDVVATGNGLVAYTGRGGASDFTPVASYPGLTNEVRSRLGEMKVAPTSGEAQAGPLPAAPPAAAPAPTKGQRADIRSAPLPAAR